MLYHYHSNGKHYFTACKPCSKVNMRLDDAKALKGLEMIVDSLLNGLLALAVWANILLYGGAL